MFLPEDNRIQTAIIQQIGTFKKRGRRQSSSKQKPKAFFVASKKKLVSQQCVIEHTLSRVAPGEPREQKNIKTKLSTTKQRHSHFAGVKTSITENQDQWAKYTRQGIPGDYRAAASRGAKARIPVGRSSKTLGQPIEAEPASM